MREITLGNAHLHIFEGAEIPISLSDFLDDAGTIDFSVGGGFLRNDFCIFELHYPRYEFAVHVRDGQILIRRNGVESRSERYVDDGRYHVAVQWTADLIGCGVAPHGQDMNQHIKNVPTPHTVPPPGFTKDLRCGTQGKTTYASQEELFARVLDCLAFCERDIRRYGSERFLWQVDGDLISPLYEPEMTRFLSGFLGVYGAINGFEVSCESRAGGGDLDFCVYGHIEDVGLVTIAIEAKKADSRDVEHGFTRQLPEYMRRLNTRYGIFLVYWLRSDRYPHPVQESYPEFEIAELHPLQRSGHVRTVGINLALDRAPSRL